MTTSYQYIMRASYIHVPSLHHYWSVKYREWASSAHHAHHVLMWCAEGTRHLIHDYGSLSEYATSPLRIPLNTSCAIWWCPVPCTITKMHGYMYHGEWQCISLHHHGCILWCTNALAHVVLHQVPWIPLIRSHHGSSTALWWTIAYALWITTFSILSVLIT